ncbi:helicase HerA-like domain-containing protein [Sinorhizobium meliloti]|uniref:helicase HerA-like domain-containing protein n=1 Tax=Rhizobium meliloti TaxID=382 RepID=UPI0001E4AB6D|nr:helicase HerA-like domain-containing protein [Sinorhizobium meliloti]MDE4591123.1 DUF853 domain-containing protein [Sinorhizobium meliloti]SEI56334.1 hypothetical protein SAMN04244575_01064 [Sinorhizobium meliloti]
MTAAALSRNAGIPLRYANRHGLITGQTGTGKTVTLQKLAESFSQAGVPVFISDVKGDIAALSRSCPVTFLDVFGRSGKALNVPIQAMGADILARALELSDVQAGTLEIAFAVARDNAMPLETIAHLRFVLNHLQQARESVSAIYGQVSAASVGVILRTLLRLETQGASRFFNNPQFDVAELLEKQGQGTGIPPSDDPDLPGYLRSGGLVSILQAERLIESPRVYGAFLLWLLSDLYERLPEIGDIERPRLVFFFDEAHLLFQDANPALLRKVEQIARLIRSKGVGVYFVTQNPDDVPAAIREQLAFRVRHSRELAIGQADFSGIDETGRPFPARAVQVTLPDCPLGALREDERPPMPELVEAPAGAALEWQRLGKPEIVLLLFCMVALAAVGFGLYSLWHAGTIGRAAAFGLAVTVASLAKLQ